MKDEDPLTIDHNPHEKRPTNAIWWAAWGMVALGWALNLYSEPVNVRWLFTGIATGALIVAWGMEMSGGKVPDWMKSAPPRRRS